jgi:hypothetical protein
MVSCAHGKTQHWQGKGRLLVDLKEILVKKK